MADKTSLQFTLTLPGAVDTAVLRFTHRKMLSTPFELAFEFASPAHDLSPTDCMDQTTTLSIWQDGPLLRRVHGTAEAVSDRVNAGIDAVEQALTRLINHRQ